MILAKFKKIISFIVLLIFSIIFVQNISHAEWITKKSDKSKELLKVDGMYANGYLTKIECTKMKAKLLKISSARGMCDDVIVKKKLITKKTETTTYDWSATTKHPKSNINFTATELSTKQKAINLAMEKCYIFVSNNLKKKGYNDCSLLKVFNKNQNTDEIFKVKSDNGEVGNWVAVIEHKVKKLIYTSDKLPEINTKQKAINNATSKCWFDKKHKAGDWPSENCQIVSVENTDKKSTFITKKTTKDKKKEKELTKKLITKKEKDLKDKKIDNKYYTTIENLPVGNFYFIAFGDNNLKIIGYVNPDPKSKYIKIGNRNIVKTNIGKAYLNDGKTKCDVLSEVDDSANSNIFNGKAILNCKNKNKFYGSWFQQNNKGEGLGVDNKGNKLNFYFVSNKKDAEKLKNPNIEYAKKIPQEIEPTFTPKKGIVNKPPIIKVELNKKIKKGSYKITGKVTDDQKTPPYLYIDDEQIKVSKDGSFEFPGFTNRDTQITVLAIDKRGLQNEVVVKVFVEKEIITTAKLEKLKPQKINSKRNNNKLAVIIGIQKYDSIQNARYANNDGEYFSEYAKKAFGIKNNNIKTLIDGEADYISSKKALLKWLKQKIIPGETEVIIFYSGHGMASLDEGEIYLLASDSDGEFIKDTALSRKEIFKRIDSYKAKSVTVFIDACYNGETGDSGTNELLIASAKPLIGVKDTGDIPNSFNVFSSSQLNQASFSTEKETGVENGIFSYYLMKGLEGNADLNDDRKITNGEMQEYLTTEIPKIALSLHNREQDPFFKGDKDLILTSF